MIGCLGLIVYGGGLLLAPRPQLRGAAFFVSGSLLVLLVRPHVALMSVGGLGLAIAVGVLSGFGPGEAVGGELVKAKTSRGRVVRLVALGVLLVVAGTVGSRVGEVFSEKSEEGTAGAALESARKNSRQGGSEFEPVSVSGPTELPQGVVSVFFRPFPWEARNLNALIAATESLLLLGLVAASWRRVISFPRLAVKRPFLVFCSAYVVAFAVGFSYIANMGILARQRVQAIPVLLVLLALPQLSEAGLGRRAGTVADLDRRLPTEGRRRPVGASLSARAHGAARSSAARQPAVNDGAVRPRPALVVPPPPVLSMPAEESADRLRRI
jgi:hypothetical protein